MLIGETLRVAVGAIRANKMRSFLTMLGIIIGIAAVITMIALGEGAQRAVESRLAQLGTNVLTVRPGQEFFGGIDRGRTVSPCAPPRRWSASRSTSPRCPRRCRGG